MAAQPANTNIKVYLAVRAQRQIHRHDSVAAIIKNLRPLVMSIPGAEATVGVLTRDTSVSDMSPYMGEARFGASRGFPIVVGALPQLSFSAAQTGLADADFAFQIGSDWFIKTTEAGLDNDMHQDLRDISRDL